MVKSSLRLLFVLFLAAAATLTAGAATLDPALQALLRRSGAESDHRVIRVIALFHEKLPRGMERVPRDLSHGEAMRLMQRMAFESQSRFRMESSPYPSRGYWFVNARAIDVPVSDLPKLAAMPEIASLGANHTVHIGRPYNHGTPRRREGAYTYGLEKLGIPKLRESMPELTGKDILVGVLDTGVEATHPDLKGKIVGWKDFIASKPDAYDDNGHGTHVAGTIAGGAASGTAIGVAPGAKIMMAKVFTGAGSASTDKILQAMEWMADPDGNPATADQPLLVSNSWGGGSPRSNMDPDENLFCKALNRWVALGILPVFAAGNSGPGASTVNVPGACPKSLSIGATDSADAVANFSSRGPVKWKTGELVRPIVSAPGVKVLSSMPGGGYKELSGTSMATPHVAGLAALLYQKNPKMKVEEIVSLLSKTATPISGQAAGSMNNNSGYGRVDALKAAETLARRRY